jgi:imidazolonepropionase-like amidohydrolase
VTDDLLIVGAALVRPPFDPIEIVEADVLVRDGRIAAISASGALPRPDGIPVLDGRSQFLLPGLIDAHVHLGSPAISIKRSLRAFLAAGVTTLREAGATDDAAFDVIRRRAARPPRIFSAGRMVRATDDERPESAAERAEAAVQSGASWLKAYALPPEDVRSVAAVAAKHRLPMAAHLGPAARESVRRADLQAIEHVFSLLEYDLVDEATRRRAALPAVDEPIATWLLCDPTRGALAEWIAELGLRRVTVTPTLTVMAGLLGRSEATMDGIGRPEAPWATLEERHWWRERLQAMGWWFAPGPASRDRRLEALRRFDEVVCALYEAGCPIAAGTDFGEPFIRPGYGLVEELRSLRRAGLPTPAILAAATSVPAQLLGQTGVLGDIVVGGAADLILVEQDPRTSIDALGRVSSVLGAGRVIMTDGRLS